MSREDASTKARRLLAEGRVRVLAASETETHISAEVRGDSASVYTCGYEADAGGWWCSCPARSACSHTLALKLIFVLDAKGTP